jgi:hypothetical protein
MDPLVRRPVCLPERLGSGYKPEPAEKGKKDIGGSGDGGIGIENRDRENRVSGYQGIRRSGDEGEKERSGDGEKK